MKYSIHNISHRPHDLDDDFIYFYYDIHFTEPETFVIKNYFCSFSELLHYLKEKHPAFHQFVKDTRSSIDAWGPAEDRTMEAMGEEGIRQLYALLEKYLLECDWMEKVYQHTKQQRNQPPRVRQLTQQQAAAKVAELSEFGPAMKKSQSRYYKFCETAEKKIRETAMEVYPEITELESEQLMEFKYLFVRDIQAMQESIIELLSGKKK